jgi:hypothetical protein
MLGCGGALLNYLEGCFRQIGCVNRPAYGRSGCTTSGTHAPRCCSLRACRPRRHSTASGKARYCRSMRAEGVGFEPTRSKLLAVFKTAAIGH